MSLYNFHDCTFKTRIKTKKIHHVFEFNQSQWLKPYIELKTQKRTEAEKNVDKDGKALSKLMNNAVNGKKLENLRNRIDASLVTRKQWKRLSKMYIKTKVYVTQNI